MGLQRIINWIMGVRYDSLNERGLVIDEKEIYNPAICEKLDCLNYGTVSCCYSELEGCRDYVKCDEESGE